MKLIDNLYRVLRENEIYIDYDIFSFGFSILLRYFMFSLSLIILSVILNIFVETTFFTVCFIVLRRYTGGFHLKSNVSCLIFSLIISLLVPYISSYIQLNLLVTLTIIFATILITFLLGPQDCDNKRLEDSEKKYYLKMAILLEIVIGFFNVFVFLINHTLSTTISAGLLCTIVNIIIAKFVNIIHNSNT